MGVSALGEFHLNYQFLLKKDWLTSSLILTNKPVLKKFEKHDTIWNATPHNYVGAQHLEMTEYELVNYYVKAEKNLFEQSMKVALFLNSEAKLLFATLFFIFANSCYTY